MYRSKMIREGRRHLENHKLRCPQAQTARVETYSLLRVKRTNKEVTEKLSLCL